MKQKVILDCDNTFGLSGCDVDDGLTLLYLLGHPQIQLLGVTLSHGNADRKQVIEATQQFKTILALDVAVYPDVFDAQDLKGIAATYLVEQVNRFPGSITILGTGALSNLQAAAKLDPDFFSKVKQIVLMGGITKPLQVQGQAIQELNFSVDKSATQAVLTGGAPLTIMNGHMTAEAVFTNYDLTTLLAAIPQDVTANARTFMDATLRSWLDWNQKHFGLNGFCNWDMTTAVYLTHPDWFTPETTYLAQAQPNLNVGQLTLANHSNWPLRMPRHLSHLAAFNAKITHYVAIGLSRGAQA